MHVDHLIRMANQIGSFFEAMPDRAQAVEDTAQHIKKFWEPRMRRELLAHVDSAGSAELNDMVAQALTRHRSVLG
ncbi:MAG: formate dehydrogenase subunit delta [Polaromonas sp.]